MTPRYITVKGGGISASTAIKTVVGWDSHQLPATNKWGNYLISDFSHKSAILPRHVTPLCATR